MNEQANIGKAVKKVSHDVRSGHLDQPGQKFSPLSLSQSPAVQTAKASGDTILVPMGHPMEESLYERLKKAAETDSSDGSVVEGQQDESAHL